MFRRYRVETKLIKDPKPQPQINHWLRAPETDLNTVIITAAVVGKDVMLLGGALYAGKRVLDAAVEIAIIAAKTKLN